MTFIYICLAGALGTGSRYLLSQATIVFFGPSIPYGTLFANILGSFLMGIVMYVAIHTNAISQDFRLILTVGFLGGFTTYSSFNQDTIAYFDSGEIVHGAFYVLTMLFACLLSGWSGVFLAKILSNTN